MGFGDIRGRASLNARSPRAQAVCDFGGEWVSRHELRKQMEWNGTALVWTGQLVCAKHYDKPQPQLRTIRLPADPVPIKNPRPEAFSLIDMPLGFTQYVMWAGGEPLPYGVELMDGDGEPILDNFGQPIIIEIGSDGVALLAQLSAITGIPVPGTIQSYNSTIAAQSVAQQLVPALADRSYIAIFNPCSTPMVVSFGTAAYGDSASLMVGTGGCLFWATAQGGATPNPAAMTVLSQYAGTIYYVYQA